MECPAVARSGAVVGVMRECTTRAAGLCLARSRLRHA